MMEQIAMGELLARSGKRAELSLCQTYRYLLLRDFEDFESPRAPVRRAAVFVLLNPSTADAFRDDPTVLACVGFARSWGCNAMEIVNLFAFRSTDPKVLVLARDPVGPHADQFLVEAARGANVLVFGWGRANKLGAKYKDLIPERAAAVQALLRPLGVRPMALGILPDGQPMHPLFVPRKTPLVPFEVRP